MSLLLVRRSFKDRGNLFEAGSVITDPSSVRLFRSRLGCRDIVELREDNPKDAMWIEYLENRGAIVAKEAKDFYSTKEASKVATKVKITEKPVTKATVNTKATKTVVKK